MKAISLWQPWASLMTVGAKLNETRSKAISYRGELVICAANKRTPWLRHEVMDDIHIQRALYSKYNLGNKRVSFDSLPRGAAVCIVDVIDCVKIGDEKGCYMPPEGHIEVHFGNYEPDRYAWVTDPKKLIRLITPVPVRGRQFLFNLQPEEERAIMAQAGWIMSEFAQPSLQSSKETK